MAFLPFREGDGFQKRIHLHLVTEKPSSMSFDEYSAAFLSVSGRLDWVYDEVDLRMIQSRDDDEVNRVISYVLKEGTDAFIAEAAFVPAR